MQTASNRSPPPKVEKEIARTMDEVSKWGFPIGKIKLKIIVGYLLNNKGIFLCETSLVSWWEERWKSLTGGKHFTGGKNWRGFYVKTSIIFIFHFRKTLNGKQNYGICDTLTRGFLTEIQLHKYNVEQTEIFSSL